MTNRVTARRLAWSIAALSLAIVAISLAISVLALVMSNGDRWLPAHLLFGPMVAIAFCFVGALVASRHARNPIGWIFSITGLLSGLTLLAASYRMLSESVDSSDSLPWIEITLSLDSFICIPALLLP